MCRLYHLGSETLGKTMERTKPLGFLSVEGNTAENWNESCSTPRFSWEQVALQRKGEILHGAGPGALEGYNTA